LATHGSGDSTVDNTIKTILAGDTGMLALSLFDLELSIDPSLPLPTSRIVNTTGCIRDTLLAGDFVYWPSNWWHESRNVGTGLSIGYSGMLVDRTIAREYLQNHDGFAEAAAHERIRKCILLHG
jgi:hypothetical protein